MTLFESLLYKVLAARRYQSSIPKVQSVKKGTPYRSVSETFSVRRKRRGRQQLVEYYYHATKGWRARNNDATPTGNLLYSLLERAGCTAY